MLIEILFSLVSSHNQKPIEDRIVQIYPDCFCSQFGKNVINKHVMQRIDLSNCCVVWCILLISLGKQFFNINQALFFFPLFLLQIFDSLWVHLKSER